jgi:hypothetical protein
MRIAVPALAALLAFGLSLGLTPPAAAQMSSPIHFAKGADHAVLSGTIVGHEYHDYVLRARAGQTMAVKLTVTGTNGDGSAFFNILPPGSSGAAIFNGSTSADGSGRVKLPEDGDYRVRVYLMGNDKDAGKTVGYSVRVSIH